MKIRYFFTVVLASIALWAGAQAETDPMYMVLTMRNGQLKAVNIEEISRLTFSDGKMNVEKKDANNEHIILADIENMEFSKSETGGIEKVVASGTSLSFDTKASKLIFNGIHGKELAIYDTKGTLVLRHVTTQGTNSLDLSAISNGVYIVTYNGNTIKIKK